MRKKIAMFLAMAVLLGAGAAAAITSSGPGDTVAAQTAAATATATAAVGGAASAVVSGTAPAPVTPKQCYFVPCHGNLNREAIYERIGDGKRDLIRSYGNYDRIHANTYFNDTDQGYGYGGDDFIYVNDGDTLDGAIGGTGYDWCYVDATIEAANTCDRVIVR